MINEFEVLFKNFHDKGLNLDFDPVGHMTLCLEACYPDIPLDVLTLYSKTRFFIRLKHLNRLQKTQDKTLKKRHMTHIAQLKD